jgi:hypothetical protein
MKKLIKLLFPKVYTTIFNEGYALGQLHYSECGPQDHNQYEEDYEAAQVYEEEYYDMIEHENQYYQDQYESHPLDFWNYPKEEFEIDPSIRIGSRIHVHGIKSICIVTKYDNFDNIMYYKTEDNEKEIKGQYCDYIRHADKL